MCRRQPQQQEEEEEEEEEDLEAAARQPLNKDNCYWLQGRHEHLVFPKHSNQVEEWYSKTKPFGKRPFDLVNTSHPCSVPTVSPSCLRHACLLFSPLLFYSLPLSVSYLTTRVERPDACHIICHRTVFVHIPRTVSLLSSSAGAIHIFGWLTLCVSIRFLGYKNKMYCAKV